MLQQTEALFQVFTELWSTDGRPNKNDSCCFQKKTV